MKTLINILAISFLISCSNNNQTAELKLDTMQCLMCSMKVEEAVANLDGAKNVEIDLKSKSGKVTYKASLIDMASIEKAIQSIGYNVNGKVAASEAYEKLELCCKIPKEI